MFASKTLDERKQHFPGLLRFLRAILKVLKGVKENENVLLGNYH